MESWGGLSHDSILDIPSSRRYRLILSKSDLEKRRNAKREEAANKR
jgi:hypothetical protein